MEAGDLTERVAFSRPSNSSDGQGGFTTADTALGTRWARVQSIRGSEAVVNDQSQHTQSVLIVVRKDSLTSTFNPRDFATWKGSQFNIVSIRPGLPGAGVAGQREFLTIEAETRAGSA